MINSITSANPSRIAYGRQLTINLNKKHENDLEEIKAKLDVSADVGAIRRALSLTAALLEHVRVVHGEPQIIIKDLDDQERPIILVA